MSFGSQTSLSQRELSQEDTTSSGSRRSSIELPDDKDRLATIDSAIKWIKNELAEIRDRDKTILSYLHRAHASIQSIHQQQQQRLKVQQDVEKRHLFGSTEDLNNTQGGDYLKNSWDNSSTNTLNPKSSRPFISSGALCTSPTMKSPICLETSADEDLLSSFLGEGNAGKLKSLSQLHGNQMNPAPTIETAEVNRRKVEGLKSDNDKKEGRKSAVSAMQLLRKQLQEETKLELDKFDQEFEPPKMLAVSDDKKRYRYSILNHMDEILNHKVNHEVCQTGHIRQHSEPVLTGSMSEWVLSSRAGGNEGQNTNGASVSSSDKPRNQSKPEFHSFRYPSNGMSHSASISFGKQGNTPRGATHYDTTVVGKRRGSRPSSRTNTLEKNKNHPLQYSIESLGEDEVRSTKSKVPPLKNVPRYSSSNSDNESTSPEIHPETSPVSPLMNGAVDPLMMTAQALEEYMMHGGETGTFHQFSYVSQSEMKKSSNHPASAPLSRRNILKTKDTWL